LSSCSFPKITSTSRPAPASLWLNYISKKHDADIKAFRKSLGLTQTEMGQWCGGYVLRTVQNWESGNADVPPGVAELVRRHAA
jgi:DNA-binding transcriptional regulator YiaG